MLFAVTTISLRKVDSATAIEDENEANMAIDSLESFMIFLQFINVK